VDGAEDHSAYQHKNYRPASESADLLEVIDQNSQYEELLDHAPERVQHKERESMSREPELVFGSGISSEGDRGNHE